MRLTKAVSGACCTMWHSDSHLHPMTLGPEYQIRFASKAPPNPVLRKLFAPPGGVLSSKDLKQLLSYRPHPALTPYWARLDRKDECIGLATLYLPPQSALLGAPVFISNFVIAPGHRGRGMGTYLLNALLGECRMRKWTRLALAFTTESIGFWQSQGFKNNIQYPNLVFKELL